MNDDAIRDAAGVALSPRFYGTKAQAGRAAEVVIDAVRPLIEAALRERLAAAIEAERDDPLHDLAGSWVAYTDAARIVRGERP